MQMTQYIKWFTFYLLNESALLKNTMTSYAGHIINRVVTTTLQQVVMTTGVKEAQLHETGSLVSNF